MKKNLLYIIFLYLMVAACSQPVESDKEKMLSPADADQKKATVEFARPSADAPDSVFFIVEEMPLFPGGEQALRQVISERITYPEDAKKEGIQGRVYITFVVDKNGSVRSARVARGVHPALDQEAIRVVESLPKWTPGKQRGENVSVSFTVPINFVLK